MYPAEFAHVYDRLMDDFDYRAWAQYYMDILSLKPGSMVCECACGTGLMTVELAEYGCVVTGIDLSCDMLGIASEKARARGFKIPFVHKDMCDLSLHKPVDAILCPCDGVNYLLTDERVSAFFSAAYAGLKTGGAFAFDVSTPEKLLNMPGASFYEDRDDVSYFWNTLRESDRVKMHLTFFVRQPGGLYRRFDETQIQRAHELSALTQMLTQAGFKDIIAYGDQTHNPANPHDLRWHITAKK